MYKLTRPDGYDFYSGTINYREAIGIIIRVTDYDPPEKGSCGRGLHASKTPNNCLMGAKIPCAAFKVKGIQPIAKNIEKTRYRALKVIEEITDLDSLFGWKYSEVINPIHPFKIKPPKISEKHIDLLRQWASVENSVWASVGNSVRYSVRASVWTSVRNSVWASVRYSVRNSVRYSVRNSMWAYIGSLFPNIKSWKYINHKKGGYPFQSVVDLWKQGLVPSFDGKIWRLHGNKDAEILWEGKYHGDRE